jgi:probable F420-dependent oxidoreductase
VIAGRIGLGISHAVRIGHDPVAEARLAEGAGFDFVSINDHVHGPQPRRECWTSLAWVAASTTKIGVASRVLGVPYRNPALVAKMAETLHRLSGGRLILGLGAGSAPEEFRALGLDVPGLGDRVTGLDEAIRVIRGAWAETSSTFEGAWHRSDRLQLEPKPASPIPIWLGTVGRRGLSTVGRLADGWIPSLSDAPPDQVLGMLAQIADACAAAGRRPGDVAAIYNLEVQVASRANGSAHVAGPTSMIADRLAELAQLGFDGFNLLVRGPHRMRQIELLGRDVLPAVRLALR